MADDRRRAAQSRRQDCAGMRRCLERRAAQRGSRRRGGETTLRLPHEGGRAARRDFLTKPFCGHPRTRASRLPAERAAASPACSTAARRRAAVERTRSAARAHRGHRCRSTRTRKGRRGALDFDDLDRPHRRPAVAARPTRPGCSTSWTRASTTSSSTRPRTPASRNGSILRALAEDSSRARAAASAHRARCSRWAIPSSRSISFQGADSGGLRAGAPPFRAAYPAPREAGDGRCASTTRSCTLSFRSAQDVLEAVDAVFAAGRTTGACPSATPSRPRTQSARSGAPASSRSGRSRSRRRRPTSTPGTSRSTSPTPARLPCGSRRASPRPIARWAADGDENGHRIRPGRRADPGAQPQRLLRGRDPRPEAARACPSPARTASCSRSTSRCMDLIALGRRFPAAGRRPHAGDRAEIAAHRPRRRPSWSASPSAARQPRPSAWRAARRPTSPSGPRTKAARAGASGRPSSGPFGFYAGVLGAEAADGPCWPGSAPRRATPSTNSSRLALDHEQRQPPSLVAVPRGDRGGGPHDQARHGQRPRRGAGDDSARREGPGGARRVPGRHLQRPGWAQRRSVLPAGRPAGSAPRLVAVKTAQDPDAGRGRPPGLQGRHGPSITGCSTWR